MINKKRRVHANTVNAAITFLCLWWQICSFHISVDQCERGVTYINGLMRTRYHSIVEVKYFCIKLSIYHTPKCHYNDGIMSPMASQITVDSIVCSTVWSDSRQRKHQSSPSLGFVGGIHRWPVDSPHKGPVMRKMFPSDDISMVHPLWHCEDAWWHQLLSSWLTWPGVWGSPSNYGK